MTELAAGGATDADAPPRGRPSTARVVLFTVLGSMVHVGLLIGLRRFGNARATQELQSCLPDCEPSARFGAGVEMIFLLPVAYLTGSIALGTAASAAFSRSDREFRGLVCGALGQVAAALAVVAIFVWSVSTVSAAREDLSFRIWAISLLTAPILGAIAGALIATRHPDAVHPGDRRPTSSARNHLQSDIS